MKDYRLNLAERPFISPMIATVIPAGLVLLILIFAAINIYVLFAVQWGNDDNEAMIQEAKQQTAVEIAEIDKIEEKLLQLDIKEYRSRANVANDIILRYTMSWTRLFNRLELIIPQNLRMLRISPSMKNQSLELQLRVEVRDQRVIRDFIANLDGSPYFTNVNLNTEIPSDGGITFEMSVVYLDQRGGE